MGFRRVVGADSRAFARGFVFVVAEDEQAAQHADGDRHPAGDNNQGERPFGEIHLVPPGAALSRACQMAVAAATAAVRSTGSVTAAMTTSSTAKPIHQAQ